MKRKILFISLISIIALLFGCTDPQSPAEPNKPSNPVKPSKPDKVDEVLQISSYYPIKDNTRYIYEGVGNEYASYEAYVSYTEGNKVQRRVDNGGTVVAEIVEVGENEITKLLSKPEIYYREDFLRENIGDSKQKQASEILLKKPLKKGNSWSLDDGRKRTITNIAADVDALGNKHKAIEVTTEGSDNSKTMDYYVKDIGLVKSIFVADEMEVSSTLKEIENDAVFTQSIKFFYPNIDDGKLYNKSKDVNFKTNDITRKTLETVYKEVLADTDSVVLTANTKINYLYLNEDGMVYIDLSKDFLTEMNAGSGYESMILDSLATTFGNYYGVDKVVLTIDGGNYESGHIVLEKGDYISVDKD